MEEKFSARLKCMRKDLKIDEKIKFIKTCDYQKISKHFTIKLVQKNCHYFCLDSFFESGILCVIHLSCQEKNCWQSHCIYQDILF